MFDKDTAILDEFASNPQEYLERDGNLAIDIKNLYNQRKEEVVKRQNMGVHNIANITESDLK